MEPLSANVRTAIVRRIENASNDEVHSAYSCFTSQRALGDGTLPSMVYENAFFRICKNDKRMKIGRLPVQPTTTAATGRITIESETVFVAVVDSRCAAAEDGVLGGRGGLLVRAEEECPGVEGWLLSNKGDGTGKRPVIWLVHVTASKDPCVPLGGLVHAARQMRQGRWAEAELRLTAGGGGRDVPGCDSRAGHRRSGRKLVQYNPATLTWEKDRPNVEGCIQLGEAKPEADEIGQYVWVWPLEGSTDFVRTWYV